MSTTDDVVPANEGVKPLDAARVTTDQGIVYRQRTENYPAGTFGDLTADAWGEAV